MRDTDRSCIEILNLKYTKTWCGYMDICILIRMILDCFGILNTSYAFLAANSLQKLALDEFHAVYSWPRLQQHLFDLILA